MPYPNHTLPAASFPGIEEFSSRTATLWPTICECRVFKTEKELALLRYINTVSSEAHLAVVQHARPGFFEYQMESVFQVPSVWCRGQ